MAKEGTIADDKRLVSHPFAAYYCRRVAHRYVPLSDSEGEDDPEVKEAERRAEERRNRRGRRRSRVMKYKHT